MALRVANDNGINGQKTVEQRFKKLTQLEHILLRPDTYIGSCERLQENMFVWDDAENTILSKYITVTPGLYKLFDEILVNAADHKQRDLSMNSIKVEIDVENGKISVWNNGAGIPVEIHKKEKVYVPELIFGHLLTSSNYDDNEKKVVGGRNGYGAKLVNIFSTEFIVETADADRGKRYKQVFRDNMAAKESPVIRSNPKGESWTKITFCPDLPRFGMTHLDSDTVALLKKRVYDIAGINSSLKMYLNGNKLPIKSFKDYVNLYIPSNHPCPVLYERLNDRWEVAITASDGQLAQVSFVNSIWTIKGGTHVSHVADQIVSKIGEHLLKKEKGLKLKPFQIKSHLSLYVNCLIENPSFDSQTKETLTTKPSKFGSKWAFSDDLAKKVLKSEIVDNIFSYAKFKQSKELSKTDGGKKVRISGIGKLEDANKAGSREASKCTLILTEGDSAKALAMSGLSVVGRDYYGIYPLKGKLLNVREAKHKQIMENAEINDLKKILGLQHKKTYDANTVKSLRYGHVLIMADQDHDGSHIKGLVINFFDHFWPSLLEVDGFLQEFITPIMKVWTKTKEKVFFTMTEYKRWVQTSEAAAHKWEHKYFKGLGTSTAKDAKEYFSKLPVHLHEFTHRGTECTDSIDLAFSKQRVSDRKTWLKDFVPGTFFNHEEDELNYQNFVNKELILFSIADNARSIPCVIDGLKPSQRKVLFSCFKRKLKKEIKVVQLAGYVSEHSHYLHGDMSLQNTIVGLAQNFIGSNNINLLVPAGQFGTRLRGGNDCASSRYIFTKLAPICRAIFPEADDPLLNYLEEEGDKIEPTWYCPIIPMVLVNGSDGIGTGWSSSIPCFNPRDLMDNIRRLLDGKEMKSMLPWYRGFRGSIVPVGNAKSYDVHGCLRQGSEPNTFKIDELPIRSWTTPYKEFLESNFVGSAASAKDPFISDMRDNGTENKICFTITTTAAASSELKTAAGYKRLKLTTSVSTSNMVLFDGEGRMHKYESPEEIIQEFYERRFELYEMRRLHLIKTLGEELLRLENRQRFILMVVDGKLKVAKRKKADIIADLQRLHFAPIAKGKSAKAVRNNADEEEDAESMIDGDSDTDPAKSGDGGYDYLLSMPLWSLTLERVEQLKKQRDEKRAEKERMEAKTCKELWEVDLDRLELALQGEEAEAEAMAADLEEVARKAQSRRNQGGSSKRGKKAKVAYQEESDGAEFELVEPPRARVVQPKKPRATTAAKKPVAKKAATTKRAKSVPKKPTNAMEDVEVILDDDDMSMDDLDLEDGEELVEVAPKRKAPRRRAAAKTQTYIVSDDDDIDDDDNDDNDDNDSESEEEDMSFAIKRKTTKKKVRFSKDEDVFEFDDEESDEDVTAALVSAKRTAGRRSKKSVVSAPVSIVDDAEEEADVDSAGEGSEDEYIAELEPVPARKVTSRCTRKPVISAPAHSVDDAKDEGDMDFEDDDSEDDFIPEPMPVRKTAGSRSKKSMVSAPETKKAAKRVPRRTAAQKKATTVVNLDSDSDEETLSLSERLANRLKVSQPHNDEAENEPSALNVAGKRRRANRTKKTTTVPMFSPSKSPLPKKTRQRN